VPPARWAAAAACAAALLAADAPALAQIRAAVVVEGLNQPLAFVQDPGDPLVQFVVEQVGRIRVLRDGVLLATPLLDVSASIVSGGEQGLLGLAFPPAPSDTRFFVNFTNRDGDTVVARFRRSASNRLVADPSSRLDLLWSTGERVVRQPFANHNGGNLVFGPDGYLYIGLGDGGSGNDPGNRAQDGGTLLGKMLRIDVNVPDADPKGFRLPPDNPFLAGRPVAALPEIWAFGLRNPWRYSFDDPALGGTGALVIGDVGQNAFEEIDYEPAGRGGRNYGWRIREGLHPDVTSLPPAYAPLTDPIFDYDHTQGIAVVGGFVYRGRALGAIYAGRYFYADLLGRVWSLGLAIVPATGEARVTDQAEHTAELGGRAALGAITSFGTDANGEIYVVTQEGGRVLQLRSPDADGDGLPDAWEEAFGLSPQSAVGNDGASGDPDGDGRTNLEAYRLGIHPRGFFRRVLGTGTASGRSGATALLGNPGLLQANLLLHYLEPSGRAAARYLRLAPGTSRTFDLVEAGADGTPRRFLVGVESDVTLFIREGNGQNGIGPEAPRR
jgi:glucose/arabinose dehydrogenase